MKKTLIILLYILLILVIITGCDQKDINGQSESESDMNGGNKISSDIDDNGENNGDNNAEETDIIKKVYNPEIDSEKNQDIILSPFSGNIISEMKFNRVVMASIENTPLARPQDGLNRAPIVYEFLVEGGITRFLALYWDNIPDNIGPIRSLRPYMIKTALEYNALLIHAGASPQGFNMINKLKIASLDQIYNGSYYWRSSDRRVPHNLFSKPKIKDYLENLTGQKYSSRFLFQQVSLINSERNSEEIVIDYWGNYKVLYQYNLQDNNYKRFLSDFENPHLTSEDQQIVVDNIIIQFVSTQVKDDVGRLQMELNGEGKALIFKNGSVIEGVWEKEEDNWTIFYDENDERVKLNPGKTWIQVAPTSTKVDYNSALVESENS